MDCRRFQSPRKRKANLCFYFQMHVELDSTCNLWSSFGREAHAENRIEGEFGAGQSATNAACHAVGPSGGPAVQRPRDI